MERCGVVPREKSASRLNSAAPYGIQALPIIGRAFLTFCCIVERTLGIGLRVEPAPEEKVGVPQAHAFRPALLWTQAIPVQHLGIHTSLHRRRAERRSGGSGEFIHMA